MTAPVDRAAAWQCLREAGIAEGETPPLPPDSAPWYVRVMLGIAGWIGALFLLGFVGVAFAFVMRNPAASLALGLAACAAAWAILRAARQNEFLTQFGFAVSLAGQILFALGLFHESWMRGGLDAARLLVMALFQAGLVLVMPHFLHRVWSAWAAAAVLSAALGQLSLAAITPGIVAAGCALAWLKEFDWARWHALLRPVGYGLALALLQSQAFLAWSLEGSAWLGIAGRSSSVAAWLSAGLVGLVLIVAAWRLIEREAARPSARAIASAYAAAAVLALLGARMPGLCPAALLTVLGFANGNRVLLGLGFAGLLAFVSGFYYRLDATLLEKAAYLALAGALLLAARLMLSRLFNAPGVPRA
jgi:hypothetical protein